MTRRAPTVIFTMALSVLPEASNAFTPSTYTCISVTPLLSVVPAVICTGEVGVAPFAGEQIVTDGFAVLSVHCACAGVPRHAALNRAMMIETTVRDLFGICAECKEGIRGHRPRRKSSNSGVHASFQCWMRRESCIYLQAMHVPRF